MDSTWLDESSLTLGLTIGSFRFTSGDAPVISNVQTPPSSFVIKAVAEGINLIQEESGVFETELNRVSTENKRLNEMLAEMTANYSLLWSQLLDFMTTASSEDKSVSPTRKRKSHSPDTIGNQMEGGLSEIACKRIKEEIRPKISKVCVRTEPSDSSLVVKDGYQWRKYGQKVTRDNPCPRAYFRCSFAPECPVKKKVQRNAEDRSILVATYEGEHNHGTQSRQTDTPIDPICTSPIPRSISQDSSVTEARQEANEACREAKELQPNLVEQMTLSLANDPGFTAALATAISERIFKLSQAHNQ